MKAPTVEYASPPRYSKRKGRHVKQTRVRHNRQAVHVNHGYLVAEYTCMTGYVFEEGSPSELYCSEGRWLGQQPVCVPEVISGRSLPK